MFLAPADREEAAHFEAFGHLDVGVCQADGVDRPLAPAPSKERVGAIRDGLVDQRSHSFGDFLACPDDGGQFLVNLALQLRRDRRAILALLVSPVSRKLR